MRTKYHTSEETAKVFRVKKGTLLGWARRGEIECYRPNQRVVLFSDEHIDRKLNGGPAVAEAKPSRNPKYSHSK